MTSITHGPTFRPQRAVAFATIAGLHVLAIYFIASGFARTTVHILMGSSVATFIKETNEPPKLPPPAAHLEPLIVDAGPPPQIPIDDSGEERPGAITGTLTENPPSQHVVPTPPDPIRLVGRHRLPNTDDYYPAAKIREGIEGASIVRVCVDENGKRTGEPTVQQTSGDAGLDRGALHVVRDGHFARSMQGDKYVPNCYAFKVIFKVRQQ
jgi:TonB family protein